MGVKIMATIGVISAAAVYGISKLRDMSNQTTQALNATSAASTQAGGKLSSMQRLFNATRVLRTGAAAVTGHGNVNSFSNAIGGANQGGIISALFRRNSAGPMSTSVTSQDIRAAMEAAAVAKQALIDAQEQVDALTGAAKKSAQSNVRAIRQEVIARQNNLAQLKLEYTEVTRNRRMSLESSRVTIRGTNALTGVAREARNWYKMLFGTATSGARAATTAFKKVEVVTRTISTSAQKATHSMSTMGAMAAGTLGAIGGTALLSGSGGIMNRAFDLSRSKEDTKTTFDTLLGSRQLTDDLTSRIYAYAAQTPFQTDDIKAASQNMLSITGKDLDKNQHLYELAAKMAALRPGTTVEDASQAILRGTFGEFDPLKTFTIALSADRMKAKNAGETGGKEYAEAVIKEIERQFDEKTGGRDIVGALSRTMSGLMSTIKDSLDLPLGNIGDKLVEGLGIKSLMTGYIEQATYFGSYIADALVDGFDFAKFFADPKMNSGVMSIADAIVNSIDTVIKGGKLLIGWVKVGWAWFDSLGSGVQQAMLGAASGAAAFSAAVGIIVPIFAGLLAMASVLWEPIAAIAAVMGSVGIALFVPGLMAAAAAVAVIGGAFMIFKKDGESLTDTVTRLGEYISYGLAYAWSSLTIVMMNAWAVLGPKLLPAWERIEAAFGRIRPYFVEIIDLMGGSAITAADLTNVGYALGNALVWLLEGAVSLVEIGLLGIQSALEFLQPYFKHTISDFKVLGKTIIDFITGAASAGTTMKTLFMGMIDLATTPFRMIITEFFNMTGVTLTKAAEMVSPFSTEIAALLNLASQGAATAATAVTEGFLKTRADLLGSDSSLAVRISGDINASVPVQLNMDGERVAETQARVGMRARNSGRGGDPMSPEEMGFVINDGRIRTVDMTAVASAG